MEGFRAVRSRWSTFQSALMASALLLGASSAVLAQPPCEGDSSRTVFATGDGESGNACRQFTDPTACEQAYHIGGEGITTCFWDGGESQCKGCGPDNEGDGLCVNTCRINECAGATTLVFAGAFAGQSGGGCPQFTDEGSCETHYIYGGDGFASCYWDVEGGCRGCGSNNEGSGACVNLCRVNECAGNPDLVYRGPAFSGQQGGACRSAANQTECEGSFTFGDNGFASCYWDEGEGECFGCGPRNEQNGYCTNSCRVCAEDSGRTIFAGGPQTRACRQFDGDDATCQQAYAQSGDGLVVSCFPKTLCVPCGGGNMPVAVGGAVTSGVVSTNCTNECIPPPNCVDDTRTVFTGGPFTGMSGGACRTYDGNQSACETAYARQGDGTAASCFYDSDSMECRGCGYNNEFNGYCTNTCVPPPTCLESERTDFVGGPHTAACRTYDGNQSACQTAYARQGDGTTVSCFYDSDSMECRGCGYENEVSGNCVNTCTPAPPCPNDSSRTIFTGGPESEGCHRFDGDATNCALAYNEGAAGITSCYYQGGSCRGCGPDNLNNGSCENTCLPPTCPEAPDKTFGPCERLNDDPTMCANAFEASEYGPVSCVSVDACLGCGLNNQSDLLCSNTCEYGVPTPTPTTETTPTPTPRSDLPDGSTCMSDTECTSTNCEQGVCCATACDGVAERCDLPGTVGICAGVAAAAPAVTPWGMILGLLALIGVAALGFRSARIH